MARIGEIIDGKYEILREVGRGGMSVVYLAMDIRLNKQWAIKEFRNDKDDVSKQVALKALLDEANLMKKLDHPTLPRIVDIINNHQTVYIIMDYIEGESLNKVLDAYGAQPQEAVIEWAKQLSDVLDYLHTQNPPVIYRDMKPANIMLKPDGTVRLIDFGIAREYKEGKEGDTEAIGTRGYAAPEQFGGKGQTDARTDIYSLGVTLYHLITGKNPAEPPYEIYPIRHWNPSLSSGLEWLIQKCTQLNPNDRYQSCAEVTYVLDNLDKFDTEYKKKKRSRFNLFITSLILTIVFAITSVGFFVGSSSAKQNSYESLMRAGNFIEAINVDKTNPEAYVELAKQIGNDVTSVKTGEPSGTKTPVGSITKGDLLAWFPDEDVEGFKNENPVAYARIEFELGFLVWEKYEGNNPTDVMSTANRYFKNVISVVKDCQSETEYPDLEGDDRNYAGLTAKEFNFAQVYFRLSYFQIHRDDLEKEDAAGHSLELEEDGIEAYAGINVKDFKASPYLAFWDAIDSTLESLDTDADKMTSILKMTTLEKIAYILNENYPNFLDEGVSSDKIRDLIRKIEITRDNVPEEKQEFEKQKDNITKDLDTVRNSIGDPN